MQTIVKLNVRTGHDGGHVTWVDVDTSDAEGRSWLLTQSSLSERVNINPSDLASMETLYRIYERYLELKLNISRP